MQNVSDILVSNSRSIISINAGDSVLDAVQVLSHFDVGALIVMDKNKMVGVFSERDYVRKVALSRREPSQILVKDVMSIEISSISPEQSLEECLRMMTNGNFRHLPVIDAKKKALGFVSILEVTRSLLTQKGEVIAHLEHYVSETWPF